MSRYDEFKVGDRAEIIHTVTERDVERFIELTGDDNKIHVNKEYAGVTSFKKPVVHGMLSAAFISTIIGTKIPGDGALWYSQSLEFLLPVRVGDTITIMAEVINKVTRLQAIELQTDIYNQEKQKVISGKARVKIVEQAPYIEKNENDADVLRIALVIGATGGIGSATCLKLADAGYDVAVHFNTNEQKAVELVNAIKQKKKNAFSINANIADEEEVNDLIRKVERRLGGISLLVNCAAIKIPNTKFDNLVWSDLTRQIDFNLKANFLLAKAIIPGMKLQKSGKVIFITSQVTENIPPAEWLPYTAAKYALNGFAKALAVEVAAHNIKINLVSPGMTETELIADIPEKARMLMAAKAPLKRLATAKDIAGVIGFLASEDANYITGETIRVNGGQVML